jgi:hypothetical protein
MDAERRRRERAPRKTGVKRRRARRSESMSLLLSFFVAATVCD